jgi:cysteine desulfurase / selenocysteine lyase
MIDVKEIRKDFPIYDNQPKLTYLDSAASSLKVGAVIDVLDHYYQSLGVNVHRGAYDLAYEATRLYEASRKNVSQFINANEDEIIFKRGTTTALNMIAYAYRDILKEGDEIITSELEHHSSILPWMMTAKKTKAQLKYIPLTKEGRITVDSFKKTLTDKTKIVAITYVSNVMGFLTPVKEIIELAHKKGAIVILDAAQAVPHMKVDVKDLDTDFLAFSGHKMFGPSGVGVLFGKSELLNMLEPVEYGGEMADEVFMDHATWKEAPLRFEAGTPVISGAIGLSAAVDYIKKIGYEDIHQHTIALRNYTIEKLDEIQGITIYNRSADISTITFNIDEVHPHDIATMLDQSQVSVRAGHHCAQLVSRFLGVHSTLRASFHIYNDFQDCDVFVSSVKAAKDFFLSF